MALDSNLGRLVNLPAVRAACKGFARAKPFPHVVIDNFLQHDWATALEREFPDYNSAIWYEYRNLVEIKRTCNLWAHFPPATYSFFSIINSPEFLSIISSLLEIYPLYADAGLHGGGWHIHAVGGKLNPHLDYSIHPKTGLQRKLNLILYLNRDWRRDWGGGLGLWREDKDNGGPGAIEVEIVPTFNRALLFETTQVSWHGLTSPLTCPPDKFRKSLANYYLTSRTAGTEPRLKALFAPTEDQRDDQDVLTLIELRSEPETADSVYRS